MTCKDCVHCDVCKEIESLPQRKDFVWYRAESGCPHFKNKTDFVEVKHGEWIKKERKYYPSYICSVCGYSTPFADGNYCKKCGAKLDGEGGAQIDRK